MSASYGPSGGSRTARESVPSLQRAYTLAEGIPKTNRAKEDTDRSGVMGFFNSLVGGIDDHNQLLHGV